MRRWLGFIALSVLGLFSGLAVADYTVKDASSVTQTVFGFVCFTTKICPAHVLVTSAGVEISPSTAALQTTINTTLGTPFQAGGSIGNTTFAATQGTAANLNATVVGTGTFATQLTGATNNINNIAGTISLPTGAGTSANQTAVQAPVAAGAASATKSVLLGGQFDTTQKTLTNGQQAALSVSARGAVFVAPGAENFAVQAAITAASGSIASGSVASGAFASGSIASGAMVDLGTQADAAWVSGSGSAISILKTISGNTGAAIPAGTALIGNVGVGQASTTSGQSGPLVQGAVTTAAPSYTTAQTSPLSLTTAGALRIDNATIAGVAMSTGSGVLGTGTQRMALATDSPGIVTLGQTTKSASVPMAIASDQVGTAGTANATVTTVQGIASMTPIIANSTNGYPTGAIAETASATGTTAATTATLATAVGKTTYICGFSIRANATAAVTGTATVTGTVTATMSFVQWTAPLASGIGTVEQQFTPCVPASATNTSIAVVSAAPGTGGTVSVAAWGFQL